VRGQGGGKGKTVFHMIGKEPLIEKGGRLLNQRDKKKRYVGVGKEHPIYFLATGSTRERERGGKRGRTVPRQSSKKETGNRGFGEILEKKAIQQRMTRP